MQEDQISTIREALDMPEGNLAELCERIRTLRQTELCARHLVKFLKVRTGINPDASMTGTAGVTRQAGNGSSSPLSVYEAHRAGLSLEREIEYLEHKLLK